MNGQEKLEESIWKTIYKYRFLRIPFMVLAFIAILNATLDTTAQAYRYVKPHFMYAFDIKPEKDVWLNDKYAFWAGFVIYDSFNPLSNTDSSVKTYFHSRRKLLKTFKGLNFSHGEIPSLLEPPTDFSLRMSQNAEIRESFEGHLESRSESQLLLYKAGFHLHKLIDETRVGSLNGSRVQDQIMAFTENWLQAQEHLTYRLPKAEVLYNEDEYFIYSQPAIMEDSINTLNAIKDFYGSI